MKPEDFLLNSISVASTSEFCRAVVLILFMSQDLCLCFQDRRLTNVIFNN
jgi:hypothetical protein